MLFKTYVALLLQHKQQANTTIRIKQTANKTATVTIASTDPIVVYEKVMKTVITNIIILTIFLKFYVAVSVPFNFVITKNTYNSHLD